MVLLTTMSVMTSMAMTVSARSLNRLLLRDVVLRGHVLPVLALVVANVR